MKKQKTPSRLKDYERTYQIPIRVEKRNTSHFQASGDDLIMDCYDELDKLEAFFTKLDNRQKAKEKKRY